MGDGFPELEYFKCFTCQNWRGPIPFLQLRQHSHCIGLMNLERPFISGPRTE